MRVLLVTHYYPEHRGGVEIVAGVLARRLARRDVQIVWAASGPAAVTSGNGISCLPMRCWNIAERLSGFAYPLWDPISLTRLCAELRKCDLIHLHENLYLGNIIAYLCARMLGKPVVVTQHTSQIAFSRQLPLSLRLLRLLLAIANRTVARLVLGSSARSIFISEKVRMYFSELIRFRKKPLYLPNGVETQVFHPVGQEERRRLRSELGWPDGKNVMLFVGRFVDKKGLPVLRKLAEVFPDCEWVFVGWGPNDPSTWGLPNVRCAASVSHPAIAAYYQAADLLVLPSLVEGFPLVVQEAMACGTPALITEDTAKGAPEIENVAFVANGNEEYLVSLLRQIVASPERLQAHRETAASFARKHWDWDRCADRYYELFADLVEKR